jgi:hypothetical protein
MIKLAFLCISLSTVFAFISPQSAAQATHEGTVVRSNYAKPLVDLRCPPASSRPFGESFEMHVHDSCADYPEGF